MCCSGTSVETYQRRLVGVEGAPLEIVRLALEPGLWVGEGNAAGLVGVGVGTLLAWWFLLDMGNRG